MRYVNYKFLFMLAALIAIGIEAVLVSSEHINITIFYKHISYTALACCAFFVFSFMRSRLIIQISWVCIALLVVLLLFIVFFGIDINGAKRWLYIYGISYQPSEFVKQFVVICTSYLLVLYIQTNNSLYMYYSFLLVALIASLLILQPDFGQTLIITTVYILQLMALRSVKRFNLMPIIVVACVICVITIVNLDHVIPRIKTYLSGSGYQTTKSLEMFKHGGLLGVGLGNGTVKAYMPYIYNDFIYAAISEELGGVMCIFILILVFCISSYTIITAYNSHNHFTFFACFGLINIFCLQSITHIGSVLGLLPTKGITIPFIGYGGSSQISYFISFGIIHALLRSYNYEKLKNRSGNRKDRRAHIPSSSIDGKIKDTWIFTYNIDR